MSLPQPALPCPPTYSADLEPSLQRHDQPEQAVHTMWMSQPGKPDLAGPALPPISQDFARPSLSETRRPATSAGVIQRLMPTASYSTNSSSPGVGDFDASPDLQQQNQPEQTYNHLNSMIMSQSSMSRPDPRTQNSAYAVALPPISQDFARPSVTETRRPATSAGIMQRSMAPGTFGAMNGAANLDAQRRASIGLGTINEHQQHNEQTASQSQLQHPHQQSQHVMTHLPHNQQQLTQPPPPHSSSSYGMPSAPSNYAHLTLDQQQHQQRRQGEMPSYNGMFAHTIDGIDPNLTGASGLNSARSMNNVRFNPIKLESANTTVGSPYDQHHHVQQQRPGSSGGPIFASDYRVGIPTGFDPATGAPNGFFGGAAEMTPQQQQQMYTLQSAASGVFPPGSYSSNGSIIDHRNSSYSSVSLDSVRHDSMTESSRNPSLPDIYLNHHHHHNLQQHPRRTSMDTSRNPSLPDIYLHQQLQHRPSTGHSTTLADAAAHQMALGGDHSGGDDPLSGPAHKKRPRRKFDQIERLYLCGFEGCNKSYGTLNHLNAHVSMQKHGEKRRPEEFKEIRAAWRKRKKEEAKMAAEHAAVVHGGNINLEDAEKAAYEAQGKWLAH